MKFCWMLLFTFVNIDLADWLTMTKMNCPLQNLIVFKNRKLSIFVITAIENTLLIFFMTGCVIFFLPCYRSKQQVLIICLCFQRLEIMVLVTTLWLHYIEAYFLHKLLNLNGDDGFWMNEVLVVLWYIMGLRTLVHSILLPFTPVEGNNNITFNL